MVDQLALDIDDRMAGGVRSSDPLSSVAGARRVNADAQRGRILRVLFDAGYPLYASEIGEQTGIPTAQVSSRLTAMEHRQLVRRLPELGTNAQGQPVLLWLPVTQGIVTVRTDLV